MPLRPTATTRFAMMPRLCCAMLLACLIVGFAKAAHADAPLVGTQPAHWRVTWTSDPSTSATISWTTAERGSSHSVTFRVKQDGSGEGVRVAESGRFTGGEVELYYHHVRLTDLQPATAYEVSMKSDADVSPTFYFVTAPSEDRSFSILHGGDSRTGRDERRAVNRMMASLVERSFQNDDPADDVIAFAHGGDYIQSGPNMAQWSAWLSDHELTVASDGRLLPVIPTRGNHDKGKPFNEVFAFPEDDLNYYGLDVGPEVRLVTLNTEISTAGDQAKWLDKELAASRPKYRWLLAQYHRPAYPAVKSPGTALESWVPLFEKYNVDLVAESDGHTIKRTVPIRNGKLDETGVVYIGEGGLGVPQRTPKKDRWYLESPGMAAADHHVFVLTFQDNTITSQCVLLDGSIRDHYSRNARQ